MTDHPDLFFLDRMTQRQIFLLLHTPCYVCDVSWRKNDRPLGILNYLLYCWYDEAGGYAVALFDEDEAFAYEFVYDFFGVVADGDEFDVGVVEDFVFVFELVDHALEVDFVVVNAK